jgi:DNA (cytosine-5)-methyltransferase 1
MAAYYNEFDPYAAQWLRNLIAAGHIPAGDVDDRSIKDVAADDLAGYGQCHFFAGIGVWAHALRLAGWGDDRPVWTGSCPCQPFSVSGKRAGFADDRHLWPVWSRLVSQCRPRVIFGEQVASSDAMPWIDAVFDDLEGEGYACGAVDLPACGVGAAHIRQRLFWVADTDHAERRTDGSAGHDRNGQDAGRSQASGDAGQRGGPVNGFWRRSDWIWHTDEKLRPVEPGARPLAPRSANHMGRLRAYGNAINAQAAAEVIRAVMEVRP